MQAKNKEKKINIAPLLLLCNVILLIVIASVLFWKMKVFTKERQFIQENIVLAQTKKQENEQNIAHFKSEIKNLKFQNGLNMEDTMDEELSLVMESVSKAEETNNEILKQYNDLILEIEEKQDEINTLKEKVESLKKEIETKKASEKAQITQQLENYYNLNRYEDRNYSKIVYLTFDDGPSYKTPLILDILDQYNIKATFFVTYTTYKDFVPYYKEIVARGHSIGIHTATHRYTYIYGSLENFKEDFDLVYNWVYEQTGVKTTLYRFPGGSVNSYNSALREKIKYFLMQHNMMYYDWNVSCGDGNSGITSDLVYTNVITTIGKSNHPIVLMHDTKQETVDALPSVIEELISMGYSFEKITSDVKPVWQGIR